MNDVNAFIAAVEKYLDCEFWIDFKTVEMSRLPKTEHAAMAGEIYKLVEQRNPALFELRRLGAAIAKTTNRDDAIIIKKIVQSTGRGGGGWSRTQALWRDIKSQIETMPSTTRFRVRGSAGSVTLPAKAIGEYIDGRGITTKLYCLGSNWALHRIDKADPSIETAVELIGMKDAAEWLASHGCDVPNDMWDCLRGRYDFDDDGKPIVPIITPAASSQAIISHGDGSYSIEGGVPIMVSAEEGAILAAFAENKRAMKTKELAKCVANVSRVIKSLKSKFPGAVHRPTKKVMDIS